jgi:hypothetical protein
MLARFRDRIGRGLASMITGLLPESLFVPGISIIYLDLPAPLIQRLLSLFTRPEVQVSIHFDRNWGTENRVL